MSVYVLHIDGKPVAVENGAAVVGTGLQAARWRVSAQPQHGKGVYTIEREGSPEGWIAPEAETGKPIAVRPLIVAPSLPPRYPPNELWRIAPVDGETGTYGITPQANELPVGVGAPDASGKQPLLLASKGDTSRVVITTA